MSYTEARKEFIQADETWGSWQSAEIIEERLHIMTDVLGLPQEATVLNIGSGASLDIQAALYAKRPDITYLAVDSGYRLGGAQEMILYDRDFVVPQYSDEMQKILSATDAWHRYLVAAFAEELPVVDGSVDYVFSHACVPFHVKDQRAIKEISRVLAPGGKAVLGPTTDCAESAEWLEMLDDVIREGYFSGSEVEKTDLAIPYGYRDSLIIRLEK